MQIREVPLLSASSYGSHIAEFKRDKLGFLGRVARECGAIGRIRVLGSDVVIVSSPELAHEVLVEKARIFDKSSSTRLILYPLAGEGLFTSRQELWRHQRKLMAPMFHPARIAGFAEAMTEAANRAADALRDEQTVEVSSLMTQIAMSIVGKTLFDTETFDEADELGAALTTALAWVDAQAGSNGVARQLVVRALLEALAERSPRRLSEALRRAIDWLEVPLSYRLRRGTRIRRSIAKIDVRIARMIADRRAVGLEKPDLLSQLLRARDESDGLGMSDKQVRDEAVTTFVAGHETTATALAWAFHHLGMDAAMCERVQREGDAFAGRTPAPNEMSALGYSQRVFKESLRMYPPIYIITRQVTEDIQLSGYDLPRRTFVIVSAYGVHHNPNVYPEPDRFDPDRFLPEAESARHRSAWIPFGSGPRVCIGNQFALLEGQIVLATLSHRVAFQPKPGTVVRPDPRATLRADNGVPMVVRRRSASIAAAPLVVTDTEGPARCPIHRSG